MSSSETIYIATDFPPLARTSRFAGWFNGLTVALAGIVAVGVWYAFQSWRNLPAPKSSVGLTLGIVGFAFMLGAETLYSLRKRVHRLTYGRMSHWMQSHIFLGLVGAFLVLLHTAGKFQGLAGAAAVVLLVVVASGFVGRYIYTAAPRTLDGIEVDSRELLARFADAERRLQGLGIRLSAQELTELSVSAATPGWVAVLGRPYLRVRHRWRVRRYVRQLPPAARSSAPDLLRILVDRFDLQLDIRSIAAARRGLAWWHVLHVPLAAVMFTLAAIHILAALRYSFW